MHYQNMYIAVGTNACFHLKITQNAHSLSNPNAALDGTLICSPCKVITLQSPESSSAPQPLCKRSSTLQTFKKMKIALKIIFC